MGIGCDARSWWNDMKRAQTHSNPDNWHILTATWTAVRVFKHCSRPSHRFQPTTPLEHDHCAVHCIAAQADYNDKYWLVVYLPLWKIWNSVGIIIPNIWKSKKCSKPPIRIIVGANNSLSIIRIIMRVIERKIQHETMVIFLCLPKSMGLQQALKHLHHSQAPQKNVILGLPGVYPEGPSLVNSQYLPCNTLGDMGCTLA